MKEDTPSRAFAKTVAYGKAYAAAGDARTAYARAQGTYMACYDAYAAGGTGKAQARENAYIATRAAEAAAKLAAEAYTNTQNY